MSKYFWMNRWDTTTFHPGDIILKGMSSHSSKMNEAAPGYREKNKHTYIHILLLLLLVVGGGVIMGVCCKNKRINNKLNYRK